MKTNTILFILLALAMLALGFCGWQHDAKRKATIADLSAKNTELGNELQDVNGIKAKLEADLAALQEKYSVII